MISFPTKKYAVIYADPPWSYRNFSGPRANRTYGSAEAHYSTMSREELTSLDVGSLAAKDCLLFLWAVFPNLPQAIELLQSWGFEYKTVAFTWIKTHQNGKIVSGLGFYTNGNAEICLLGRRGKFVRVARNVKQVVMSPRGRHSEKPAEIRNRIVALTGDVPRIELFTRQRAEGWDAWGNEVAAIEKIGG